jgi:hypothetical protein
MTDLRPILTLISPKQTAVLTALNNSNIRYEVAANNFQKVVDAERGQNEINRNKETFLTKEMFSANTFDYDNTYHTYAQIVAEMQNLNSEFALKKSFKS